jgi:hypothetical protein
MKKAASNKFLGGIYEKITFFSARSGIAAFGNDFVRLR